jgi:hypothetical protein
MNWFQRHLNWTFVLSWLASFVAALMGGDSIEVSADGIFMNSSSLLGLVVPIAVLFVPSAWVIRRKGQSLGWILLAGLLSPLGLGNKKKESEPREDVNLAND